jgi:hypothetical protein
MADRDVSAPEIQAALIQNAQKRMDDSVKMWMANPKVKAALGRFDPAEVDQRDAC